MGRTRAAVLLCCAVVLAALLTACGDGAGTVRESPQRMLNRHAAAVLKQDEGAFLADVAPGLREKQRQVFRNLARLPLAGWSYQLVRHTGTSARVQLRYRLKGYDTAPVTSDMALTLAGNGGRWRIAATAPDGSAHLWDQGAVRVARGAHSLVIGVGASQASLKAYAAEVDRAVAAVGQSWGDGWTRRVVVEVPGSLREMAALLDASPTAYEGIAAVTTAELRGTGSGSGSVPADRVIVNPEAFAELSALGRRVVLTHETTHVATRTATTSGTPLWLSEGFADWVGYRGTGRTVQQVAPELTRDAAAGRLPQALPSDADFGTTATGLAQSYEGGWLACRLIADQWGTARLTALYRAVGDGATADAAMRRTLGLGIGEFTARWRAYVQRELA